MSIRQVLLVCSGNTCRSPMAMAILGDLWKKAGESGALVVHSAGVAAFSGMTATEHAVAAMRERGMDLSAHRSQPLPSSLEDYDLVLTMTGAHRDAILARHPAMTGRVFTLGEYAGTGQDVPDPFGGALSDYQSTAAVLESMLRAILNRIRTEGRTAE